jgi:GNAT superfamily N-acetyltransferase
MTGIDRSDAEKAELGAPVQLRRATPADAIAIRRLTRDAYAKWAPIIGREPRPMTADYEEAVRKHRFDLLYVDAVLAGLIETVEEPRQLLIENVAVAPAFHGRGLGRKLLAHAEEIALALGYVRIRLYTNKLFAENVRLYARIGYQLDREEDAGDAIAVHMSKDLSLPLAWRL